MSRNHGALLPGLRSWDKKNQFRKLEAWARVRRQRELLHLCRKIISRKVEEAKGKAKAHCRDHAWITLMLTNIAQGELCPFSLCSGP